MAPSGPEVRTGQPLVAAHEQHRRPVPWRLALCIRVNDLGCRFWYRARRIGPCTVPATGPVIIAANHTSTADPLILYSACRYRKISFLIAREFANPPIGGYFIRLAGCIPVRRDGHDVAATKQAIRRLRDGAALAVFIEGRITPPGELRVAKDGVAVLALRTGAPVIPAHISGTVYCDGILDGLIARHRARVRFGPPVDLTDLATSSNRQAVSQATRRIDERILALANG